LTEKKRGKITNKGGGLGKIIILLRNEKTFTLKLKILLNNRRH